MPIYAGFIYPVLCYNWLWCIHFITARNLVKKKFTTLRTLWHYLDCLVSPKMARWPKLSSGSYILLGWPACPLHATGPEVVWTVLYYAEQFHRTKRLYLFIIFLVLKIWFIYFFFNSKFKNVAKRLTVDKLPGVCENCYLEPKQIALKTHNCRPGATLT